jgi:hypothetical protein
MTAFVVFIFKSAGEGTKHEFNVKYERYKQDIGKDRKLCLEKKL